MKRRLLPERSVDQNHFFVNGSLINQPNGIVWKHKCDQTPRKTSDVCFQLLPGTISCDQQPDVVSSINQTTCCCLWVHFLVSIVLAWCLQQLLWRRSVYSLSLLSHRSSTPKVTNKKDGSSERKEVKKVLKYLNEKYFTLKYRAHEDERVSSLVFHLVVISLINIQIIPRGGYRIESLSSAVKVGCSLWGASAVLSYCVVEQLLVPAELFV